MFLEMNGPTTIVLVIVITAVIVSLAILLYRSARKEKNRYKEEKAITIEGLLSKSAITSQITSYLSKTSSDSNFSLLLLEIQDFDSVIDAFGKKEAERTLEKAIYRVIHSLPKRIQIASFGGTRFILFLKTDYDRFFAIELSKKIITLVNRPIKIFRDTSINFVSNIGIAFYPKHGTKFRQLVNSLDMSLYNAVKSGENKFMVFSQSFKTDSSDNVEYHFEIKEAIEKKEFIMQYQPIIDTQNQTIYGFEAFVRWQHPKHGMLSPVQFLNIMEQTGDISWIGSWGLETIIKESYDIARELPDLKLMFTINISPKQLMSDKIADEFGRLVKKYKMNTSRISLEIAEYSQYEKNSVIKANLSRLIKLGFPITINGFGLDYSTLADLETMEVDIIRLDKYFFDKENESFLKNRLTSVIVDFATKHERIVIAEGVESEGMLNMVKESGIKYVQGYIYSKPLFSQELLEYIKKQTWLMPLEERTFVHEEIFKSTIPVVVEEAEKKEKEYITRQIESPSREEEEKMLREAYIKTSAAIQEELMKEEQHLESLGPEETPKAEEKSAPVKDDKKVDPADKPREDLETFAKELEGKKAQVKEEQKVETKKEEPKVAEKPVIEEMPKFEPKPAETKKVEAKPAKEPLIEEMPTFEAKAAETKKEEAKAAVESLIEEMPTFEAKAKAESKKEDKPKESMLDALKEMTGDLDLSDDLFATPTSKASESKPKAEDDAAKKRQEELKNLLSDDFDF